MQKIKILQRLKTALHLASKKGHQEIIKYLKESGASEAIKDAGGHTPSFYALILTLFYK